MLYATFARIAREKCLRQTVGTTPPRADKPGRRREHEVRRNLPEPQGPDGPHHGGRQRHRRIDRRAFRRPGLEGRLPRHQGGGIEGARRPAQAQAPDGAFRAVRPDGHRGRSPRHQGGPESARADHRPRQQCRPRRAPQARGRHPGVFRRPHPGEPPPPVLHGPGGGPGHEEGEERLDHQHGLDLVDAGLGRHAGLHRRQGRRARHDARPRPRARRVQHPRQLDRARLDHDRAAEDPLGEARLDRAADEGPVPAADARAGRHRPCGGVLRFRRGLGLHQPEHRLRRGRAATLSPR